MTITFDYEPPRGDLPPGIESGRVHGRVLRAVDDADDLGIDTDTMPAQGDIRFYPQAPYIEYGTELLLLDSRVAPIDADGNFEIDLVATTNTAPVDNWRYLVQFNVPGLNIPSFYIDVPANSDRALADVVPRSTLDTYITTKGDKGDKGDLSILGLNIFPQSGDLAVDDTQVMFWGTGSPEGVLNKPKASLYVDKNAAQLYIKSTSGTATGWKIVTRAA